MHFWSHHVPGNSRLHHLAQSWAEVKFSDAPCLLNLDLTRVPGAPPVRDTTRQIPSLALAWGGGGPTTLGRWGGGLGPGPSQPAAQARVPAPPAPSPGPPASVLSESLLFSARITSLIKDKIIQNINTFFNSSQNKSNTVKLQK